MQENIFLIFLDDFKELLPAFKQNLGSDWKVFSEKVVKETDVYKASGKTHEDERRLRESVTKVLASYPYGDIFLQGQAISTRLGESTQPESRPLDSIQNSVEEIAKKLSADTEQDLVKSKGKKKPEGYD